DELVIAGQGTIANEILRQWRDVEYVFVACKICRTTRDSMFIFPITV
ncbi:hypothetical protein IAG04_18440, partial [Acinetobacter baumannii]|nr:hypothetical protein [Acinetobacter baumannii]